MWGRFQSLVGKLLRPGDDDPMGGITADQLAIVLKSIEGKYEMLHEENDRLKERIAHQETLIGRLNHLLEAHGLKNEAQRLASLQESTRV